MKQHFTELPKQSSCLNLPSHSDYRPVSLGPAWTIFSKWQFEKGLWIMNEEIRVHRIKSLGPIMSFSEKPMPGGDSCSCDSLALKPPFWRVFLWTPPAAGKHDTVLMWYTLTVNCQVVLKSEGKTKIALDSWSCHPTGNGKAFHSGNILAKRSCVAQELTTLCKTAVCTSLIRTQDLWQRPQRPEGLYVVQLHGRNWSQTTWPGE